MMTENELQEVVAAVIEALKTNGRTIMQLTPVESVSDDDYFELHGGRRIAYSYLYSNLLDETQGIIDTYTATINDYIASVRTELLGDLDDKPDYYDASWLSVGQSVSGTYFNNLVGAINDGKLILVDGIPVLYAVAETNTVRSYVLKGKGLTLYTATKSGSDVSITTSTVTLLDNNDQDSITLQITTLSEAVNDIVIHDNEQDYTLAQHASSIQYLGTIKVNSSDVYLKSQIDAKLAEKVNSSDLHTIAGQNILLQDIITYYVESLIYANQQFVGSLSFVDVVNLEQKGVNIDLEYRGDIYQKSHSDSTDKMWTCGMKRLRLTNTDLWIYEENYLEVPAQNVMYDGIDDEDTSVDPASVSDCLDTLFRNVGVLNEEVQALAETYLTQEEYDVLVDEGGIDPNMKYFIFEE